MENNMLLHLPKRTFEVIEQAKATLFMRSAFNTLKC